MSLAMLLEMAVSAYGERPALLAPGAPALTYEELGRRAASVASALSEAGASSCAFVGVNSPDVPVLMFGAALAGVPFAPLNYRLAAPQLRALIDRLPEPMVVADEAYRQDTQSSENPAHPMGDLLGHAPGSPREASDDDPAVLLFTSGTTAEPKCVVLRHRSLVAYVLQTVDFASADPADAALTCVPPYHVAGVGSALTNIYAGRRLCYLADFTPQAWLEQVRCNEVTVAMVVPTMLARVVEHLGDAPADVPTLRSLAYGGARIARATVERAMRAFPQTGFVNAYGLTETSSTIAVLGPDDHRAAIDSDDPQVRARLGSAGLLVPGIHGQIVDEGGTPVPAGVVGELRVRGPQVSGEYVGGGSTLDPDGWFATRDRAWFDRDGYLFIEGRADDTIIRGAENIAPSEIEEVLTEHPAVRDAAVVGIADEEWGERLAAVVVVADGATVDAAELRAWVRARLRSSRTPDEVHFRTELPYTPTGKLVRRQLAQEITLTSHTRSEA